MTFRFYRLITWLIVELDLASEPEGFFLRITTGCQSCPSIIRALDSYTKIVYKTFDVTAANLNSLLGRSAASNSLLIIFKEEQQN